MDFEKIGLEIFSHPLSLIFLDLSLLSWLKNRIYIRRYHLKLIIRGNWRYN